MKQNIFFGNTTLPNAMRYMKGFESWQNKIMTALLISQKWKYGFSFHSIAYGFIELSTPLTYHCGRKTLPCRTS